jgi:hypothetical protein
MTLLEKNPVLIVLYLHALNPRDKKPVFNLLIVFHTIFAAFKSISQNKANLN